MHKKQTLYQELVTHLRQRYFELEDWLKSNGSSDFIDPAIGKIDVRALATQLISERNLKIDDYAEILTQSDQPLNWELLYFGQYPPHEVAAEVIAIGFIKGLIVSLQNLQETVDHPIDGSIVLRIPLPEVYTFKTWFCYFQRDASIQEAIGN